VLYECLTNERPYTGPNNAAIVQAVLTETPRPASACRADLPTELDAIVMRAVTGAEGTRYQDARSLQIDLEKYLLSTGTTVTSFHLAEWLHGHIAGRAPASSSALPSSFTPTGDSVSVTKTAPPKERS
jgi:serine/threonine-protein kinase